MKEKISFVNEIWNVGAPRWRPYFEQRNRRPTKLCHTQCWKRGFLFFIEAWIQRHQQSPRVVILKAVCRFVVLLLSTFSGFSIFTAGFLCLWQLCSLLCRPPQRSTERSRILIHRHWRQEVQLSHCLRFQEARWSPGVGSCCLRTSMS